MIGVLNLQGGVAEHIEHLTFIGVPCCAINSAEGLKNISGLIIPGGESTCLARLLHIFELDKAIINEYQRGMKIWGTCAGAIILAKKIVGEQPVLNLMDIEIERNSFGSQLNSFTASASIPGLADTKIPLVFIRAPKILSIGKTVRALLKPDDYIVAAEDDNILATVFHPELTNNNVFHRYFARKCDEPFNEDIALSNTEWKLTSWMHSV